MGGDGLLYLFRFKGSKCECDLALSNYKYEFIEGKKLFERIYGEERGNVGIDVDGDGVYIVKTACDFP